MQEALFVLFNYITNFYAMQVPKVSLRALRATTKLGRAANRYALALST
jgi:hypothetical protein